VNTNSLLCRNTVQPPRSSYTLDTGFENLRIRTELLWEGNILSPWSRALLEKLTVPQLIKKFPALNWNQKVYYHVHTSQLLVSIQSQINPVHGPPPILFLKDHFSIILPPTSMSSKWSLCPSLPHQNPVCTSPLPHNTTCPPISCLILSPE